MHQAAPAKYAATLSGPKFCGAGDDDDGDDGEDDVVTPDADSSGSSGLVSPGSSGLVAPESPEPAAAALPTLPPVPAVPAVPAASTWGAAVSWIQDDSTLGVEINISKIIPARDDNYYLCLPTCAEFCHALPELEFRGQWQRGSCATEAESKPAIAAVAGVNGTTCSLYPACVAAGIKDASEIGFVMGYASSGCLFLAFLLSFFEGTWVRPFFADLPSCRLVRRATAAQMLTRSDI